MFATPTGKRTFDESVAGEVEEVELSLKRKKLRILPIRTSTTFYHHPGPADSPMIIPPDPPTLTPAQSDEENDDEARGMCDAYSSSLGLPSIRAEAPDDGQCAREGDYDMVDSFPMHSSDGMSLASPYNMAQRVPTPRYGGFFTQTQTSSLGRDWAKQHDEKFIVQAMGMSSLNRTLDSRMLPSPINEGERYNPGGLRSARLSHHSNHHPPTYPQTADEDMRMDLGSPRLPAADGVTMREAQGRLGHWRTGGSGEMRGKPMLVMGFRADCEKCKARVPGHYSHIVRSL
ncbi:MAG: hypothetical protein M1823_000208 [Watsoniomyces obsoletus]|nr:MAG: hypothetical protein M1823_000208 [Watsoniomyces obsoletus]